MSKETSPSQKILTVMSPILEAMLMLAAENAKGFYAAKSDNRYIHPKEFAREAVKTLEEQQSI